MEVLRVTVVGQELFKIISEKFDAAGLEIADELKSGMFGNQKTRTYIFELHDSEIIEKRKKLMNEISKDYLRMVGLYVHGDWMRIFVIKPMKD